MKDEIGSMSWLDLVEIIIEEWMVVEAMTRAGTWEENPLKVGTDRDGQKVQTGLALLGRLQLLSN